MTMTDYAKALGAAFLIMVLNVAISYLAVAVYSYVINPGHDTAYYESVAMPIILGSAILAGLVLFFISGYFFTKRKPERNAMHFAVAIWVGYVLIEALSIAAAGTDGAELKSMTVILGTSLITKLIAIIAGVKLAAR